MAGKPVHTRPLKIGLLVAAVLAFIPIARAADEPALVPLQAFFANP